MSRTKRLLALISILALLASQSLAQDPKKHDNKQAVSSAPSPVVGSGTAGQMTKWTGVDGSNTYGVGDSNITEDKSGKVGIGTRTPTSLFTVRGVIESTLGGIKFPDGTTQTTSTAGALFGVAHDATLQGAGTTGSPLGVAAPLMVRDLDNPARQPVQIILGTLDVTFSVPAGKRLVIEFLDGFVLAPTPPTPQERRFVRINTTLAGSSLNHLIIVYAGAIGVTTVYMLSQVTKIYADPGTQVTFTNPEAFVAGEIILSGQYVDVP